MLKSKEKAGCMLKNKKTTVKTNGTRGFNPHVLRMQHRSWMLKCTDTKWG